MNSDRDPRSENPCLQLDVRTQELGRAPALADREYRSRLKAEALNESGHLGCGQDPKTGIRGDLLHSK